MGSMKATLERHAMPAPPITISGSPMLSSAATRIGTVTA